MKTSNKILLAVGILLTAFFIYYKFRFQHFKVATTSMHSSFLEDDILLFDKHIAAIKTNDIVAFNTSFIDVPVCSRVVGMPNDKIEIKDAYLLVNSVPLTNENLEFKYLIVSDVTLNERKLLKRKTLLEPFILNDGFGTYHAFLNGENEKKIDKIKGVKTVTKILHLLGYQYLNSELTIFPNHKNYNWSRDNFGVVTVPKMGVKIELNTTNIPLYIEVIKRETEKSITEIKHLKSYTFKQDYYFMMSDNRHNGIDSRYFGFVSIEEIIGVYSSTLYSPD